MTREKKTTNGTIWYLITNKMEGSTCLTLTAPYLEILLLFDYSCLPYFSISSPVSGDGCCSTLLVGGDREFNVTGFKKFTKFTKFANVGLSYLVVAIIGPQSSGKSTLLNHLFHTNFKEMDAYRGRSQTTKGIWVAKCPTNHPFTLVMDMEGTDGKQRGEDTAFEKQSTLFALAVADIVLINIWCHDIGREHASNVPLLNTAFQMMMRLFGPRKTTLIFVIRDKTKTPLESLQSELQNDIQKIWESAPWVACMRQKLFHHNKLAGDLPASGFSLSLQEIWEKIKKDRDLDIPSIKVMVATVSCEEIANEKYSAFAANELVKRAFQKLLELKRSSTLDKFKEAFDKALDGVIKGFSVTARNFTESFMAQFDEGCADAVIKQANWDTSKVRDKLRRDIEAHVASVHADKIKDHCEAKLRGLLSGPVEVLLKQANNKTWPTIRRRLREAELAFCRSAVEISGFDMDEQTKAKIDASLEKYVRRMVDAKAKEEAGRVLIHMKERFITKFSYDSNSIPRVWNRPENIGAIARTAHSSSLEVLSVMAVIRLDGDDDGDKIQPTLISALLDKDRSTTTNDQLASNTWEEVPSSKTLIIPLKCKELWEEFKENTKDIVSKAVAEQKANARFQLPPWAIGCLIFAGYNAITRLMR
ncbi:protein ROOT HAIR DEFECTIVE 3-like [Prunus avium]|uniref:Protein ROOT HAIR DEFECTIVE 3-like n=1 Tax=Prunus avium TaxID=42229 RepID=A0A6P5TJG1_PRUAV|nr:protein ROOT HAIR DEFECTIVE 3-like [Prunus avium]